MATANDTTLTAEAALDEVLTRAFGNSIASWRDLLEMMAEAEMDEDAGMGALLSCTLGDLRRWSAPLRTEV